MKKSVYQRILKLVGEPPVWNKLTDYYSGFHLAAGLSVGLALNLINMEVVFKFVVLFVVVCLFEVLERVYFMHLGYEQESYLNVVGDVILGFVGGSLVLMNLN